MKTPSKQIDGLVFILISLILALCCSLSIATVAPTVTLTGPTPFAAYTFPQDAHVDLTWDDETRDQLIFDFGLLSTFETIYASTFTPKYFSITASDTLYNQITSTRVFESRNLFTAVVNGEYYLTISPCYWFYEKSDKTIIKAQSAESVYPSSSFPSTITLPTTTKYYIGTTYFPDPTTYPSDPNSDLKLSLRCSVGTTNSQQYLYSQLKLNLKIASDDELYSFTDVNVGQGYYRNGPNTLPTISGKSSEIVLDGEPSDYAIVKLSLSMKFTTIPVMGDYYEMRLRDFPSQARVDAYSCDFGTLEEYFTYHSIETRVEEYNYHAEVYLRIYPNYYDQLNIRRSGLAVTCDITTTFIKNYQIKSVTDGYLPSTFGIGQVLYFDTRYNLYCSSLHCRIVSYPYPRPQLTGYTLERPTPQFITGPGTTLEFQLSTDTRYNYYQQYQALFPSNILYDIYAKTSNYGLIKLGSTIINWDDTTFELHITQERFPYAAPIEYHFIPTDPLYRNNEARALIFPSTIILPKNIVFHPLCLTVTFSAAIEDEALMDTSRCENDMTCDKIYGVCNCQESDDFLIRANPTDLCFADCSGITNMYCGQGVSLVRNSDGYCVCQTCLSDPDSVFGDCTNDVIGKQLRQQYPTVQIRTGFSSPPTERNDDDYDNFWELANIPQSRFAMDRILYNFGSVQTFYNANYHISQYFIFEAIIAEGDDFEFVPFTTPFPPEPPSFQILEENNDANNNNEDKDMNIDGKINIDDKYRPGINTKTTSSKSKQSTHQSKSTTSRGNKSSKSTHQRSHRRPQSQFNSTTTSQSQQFTSQSQQKQQHQKQNQTKFTPQQSFESPYIPCEWYIWDTPQTFNGPSGEAALIAIIPAAQDPAYLSNQPTDYIDIDACLNCPGGHRPSDVTRPLNALRQPETFVVVTNPFYEIPYNDLSTKTKNAYLELHCYPGLFPETDYSSLKSSMVMVPPLTPLQRRENINTMQTTLIRTQPPQFDAYTEFYLDLHPEFGATLTFTMPITRGAMFSGDRIYINPYYFTYIDNGIIDDGVGIILEHLHCTQVYQNGIKIELQSTTTPIEFPVYPFDTLVESELKCTAVYVISPMFQGWEEYLFIHPEPEEDEVKFEFQFIPSVGSPFVSESLPHHLIPDPSPYLLISEEIPTNPTITSFGPGSILYLIIDGTTDFRWDYSVFTVGTITIHYDDGEIILQSLSPGFQSGSVIIARIPPTATVPNIDTGITYTIQLYGFPDIEYEYFSESELLPAYNIVPSKLVEQMVEEELPPDNTCTIVCRNGGIKDDINCSCDCSDEWTGATCTTCALVQDDCPVNSILNTDTCTCECQAPFFGENCLQCSRCKNGGTPTDSTCTSCTCPVPFTGNDCSECTLCRNGGIANQQCTMCECKEDLFWVGIKCDTCQLQCFNNGIATPTCSSCVCPRNGYSGKHCECHIITFTITLQSVPQYIMTAFVENDINWLASANVMEYLRNSLYQQSIIANPSLTREMYSTIQITSLQLGEDVTNPSLTLKGRISDNCALDDTNNYDDLQYNFIKFLGLLKPAGLDVTDDENVPITDISYQTPDLKCDQLYDQGCGNIPTFKPQEPIEPNTTQLYTISMISIIVIIVAIIF